MFRGAMFRGRLFLGQMWARAGAVAPAPTGPWVRVTGDTPTWTRV